VIEIDTNKWAQGEGITVAKFSGKEFRGKQYSGVEISMTADPRDVMDELYKLEAVGEKPASKFILTKPLVEAPHWRNKKVYERQVDCEAVKKGHAIAATAYKSLEPQRKLQKIMLKFDSDMRLHDRFFVPDTEEMNETEVECKVIMGKVDTGIPISKRTDPPETLKIHSVLNTWRLVDMASMEDIEGLSKKARGQRQLEDILGKGEDESP
jgi:hypothetical protein